VANSLAALEAGARQVECTINGIGARLWGLGYHAWRPAASSHLKVRASRWDHGPILDAGAIEGAQQRELTERTCCATRGRRVFRL
jgi:hypothetical protein